MVGDRTTDIPGYTYDTSTVERSPVTLTELDLLKGVVGLTLDDERYLRDAAETFRRQAESLADVWRSEISSRPQLAYYSARADGSVDPHYSEASRKRLVRWIIDVCTRPYDQAWLDYQHEIGLRHTRAKKNQTDAANTPDHIPMRYVLAFLPTVLESARELLTNAGYRDTRLETTHAAWCKAVLLHVTLWTRAYVEPGHW